MDRRRLAGAIAGGLIAGVGITAMLIAGERKSGKPSQLASLERAGARQLGVVVPNDARLPDPAEQTVIQGGHLLLSAVAGAGYALTTDEDDGAIASGIGFGMAFYAAAHWIAGPLLGLKAPEWRSDAKIIGMHLLNHIGFGVIMAAGAKLAAKR